MRIHEWQRTLTYCTLFVLCGSVSGMLGPSLIYLADIAHASVSEISILFTARGIGNLLGALLASRMYERFSGHHYLIAMLGIVIIGLMFVPFSTSLLVLVIIFFLLGGSEVSINTGGNLMMLWLHKEKTGSYVTVLHLSYSFGSMVVPLVFVFCTWAGGNYGWGFWLITLYALLFPVLLWRQPSPAFSGSHTEQVAPEKQKSRFYAYLLVVFFYTSVEVSVAGWLSTYGVLQGWDKDEAALLTTWFFLALALGRLFSVPLQRWISAITGIYTLMGITLLSTVIMMLVPQTALGFVAFALGVGCSALFPMMFSFANSILTLTGARTGIVFVCCGLGALIAPTLSGPIIDFFSVKAFPVVLFVLAGMLLFSWFRLLSISRK